MSPLGTPGAPSQRAPRPAKPKLPDYRRLKLSADDVIGGVRAVNPWREGTKGREYYAVLGRADRRRGDKIWLSARIPQLEQSRFFALKARV